MLTVFGCKGCGNVVIEAICLLTGEPFVREEVDPYTPSVKVEALRAKNPNVQVPTVVTEDGTILTESVALALWLTELHPEANLAPKIGDPRRATFLRWLVYFAAAIYPMYVVGDVPARFVEGTDEQRNAFKLKTVDRVVSCWRILEQELAPNEWLLGDSMTVLDVFAAVMTRWRPGRDKLREVAPRAVAIAERVEKHPELEALFAANF